MAKCTRSIAPFARVKKRTIDVAFGAADVTGDAGVLLLGQVDRKLRLTARAAAALSDSRRPRSCLHSPQSMLRQRVYALGLGHEDLNDHKSLRSDVTLQTATGTDADLASASTLCRFENAATRQDCVGISQLLVEVFVESFKTPPKEITLDFDSTEDKVHGEQMHAVYNGHYGGDCFLPLYVYCGSQLLVAYLRPGSDTGPRHAWAILALLVRRLRQSWPKVKILFRADSAFCNSQLLQWCETADVRYVVGARGRKPLKEHPKTQRALARVEAAWDAREEMTTCYDSFWHRPHNWIARKYCPEEGRRHIVKAKHDILSATTRFVVTNLAGDPQRIYEEYYDPRGDMENRLKEQKLSLFSDRTSCHDWWANQLRVLLSAMAYVLIDGLRRTALAGTELARAQCGTIRLKLLKIGAVVERNSRRVRVIISRSYPQQDVFQHVIRFICTS